MISRLKSFLFENRSLRQTITKNIFWLSLSNVGSRFIRAIIIIYAARVLGASEYGIFSYVLGLAGFFTIFADIGVNQIFTREAAKDTERSSHYFASSFWLKIFLFFITALLVIFIAPYFSKFEAVRQLVPFVALLVVFDGLREFCLAFFRARQKMELETLITILTNVGIVLFGFLAIFFSATSRVLTFSYIAATGVGALAAVFILKEEFKKIITHFDKNLVKPIVNSAWPIAFVGIIGAFMLNTDVIMIGWWRTASEIGFYSASQRIIQVLYSLPAILAGAIFPALAKLISQKDNERIKLLTEKSIVLVFLVAIPIAVGGIILGAPIIELIYGKEYLPAVLPFKILILTTLIIFPATLIGNSILAYNRQKKMAGYMAIAAFGNVVFNAILIPFYGIVGAAIATITTQLVSNSLSWRLLKKINNFYAFRYLKKIIASAIIMGIFSFVFNKLGLNLIVNIIASAGIYFGGLYLLKEEILGEAAFLLKAFRRS